jgi:diguanylate cyclase (GGDEF)-like protein/PAS domain S-box-containing protein
VSTYSEPRVQRSGAVVPSPRQTDGTADRRATDGVVPARSREGTPGPGQELAEMFATWASFDDEPLLVVNDVGPALQIEWANRASAQMFGYAESELVGAPLVRLLRSPFAPGPADQEPDARTLVDTRRAVRRSVSLERRDGSRVRVALSSLPVSGRHWVLRLAPEADLVRVAEDLRASHERFQALAGQAPIAIFSSESGLRLGYVNDRFCEMHGESAERLLGTEWLSFLHGDDVEEAVTALSAVLTGTPTEMPLRLVRRDGQLRHVLARIVPVRASGREAGFIGTLEDVTERRAWEATLEHQATHDPLTGLPNRRLLMGALDRHLRDRRRNGSKVALIFLDLDEFKLVNDSLGHEAGDLLLVDVANRLGLAVRQDDLVARFGGDEFAVLCPGIRDEDHAAELAQRLLDAVTGPAIVGRAEVNVGASIGVVVAGSHREAEGVLRDADVAMYQAKAAGKNTWALFDAGARAAAQQRLALVADLRRVLDEGTLDVFYQPVVRVPQAVLGGGMASIKSVEALVRWTHPVHGPVSPEEFVGLAEQNGMVVQLGEHVLRQACKQMVAWRKDLGDRAPVTVSVNVSAVQLRRANFVDTVADVLTSTGLPGERLCLELTETVVMDDATAAAASFAALRRLGVRVSIDDFGTGYSSLALLRWLPVDQLKIDRSLLRHLAEDPHDPVVAAVVALAHALGLEVVAEGVETSGQLRELHRLQCPLAQGFLFSAALPADRLAAALRQPSTLAFLEDR